MATFAQWVKDQQERDDQVGYFARYFAEVTPGKVSTPTGILRVLNQVRDRSVAESDEKSLTRADAAITGYNLAVPEYQKDQALRQAIAAGAIPDPAAQPDDAPAQPDITAQAALAGDGRIVPVLEQVANPDPSSPAGRLKALANNAAGQVVPTRLSQPDDRLARLEARLDAIAGMQAQNQRMLDAVLTYQLRILSVVDPEPVDWDTLWAEADHRDLSTTERE